MTRTQAADHREQKLLDDIRKFGWHCINVFGDEQHQPFTYTIGLFHTYGHPELLIYGLPRDVANRVLSIAADAAARGEPFDLSEPSNELLKNYPCVFVRVPLAEYREHFGFARWYYEGSEFPVHQIVWPSKAGHFPWHSNATDDFRSTQPVLGQQDRST